MSGLTFRIKANPGERLNIAELTPSKLESIVISQWFIDHIPTFNFVFIVPY